LEERHVEDGRQNFKFHHDQTIDDVIIIYCDPLDLFEPRGSFWHCIQCLSSWLSETPKHIVSIGLQSYRTHGKEKEEQEASFIRRERG
jgi:hypothetical protein